MALTDFTSGLQSASDYLDTRHHLSGTTALGSDALRVVANAEYSFSLREILCGVLGGNGLKMPNLQICMSSNINALLKSYDDIFREQIKLHHNVDNKTYYSFYFIVAPAGIDF